MNPEGFLVQRNIMFYLMDGGATLPMVINSEPGWAVPIGDALMFMLCFHSLQPLITSMDQVMLSSFLILYCSWFSYVLGLFSSFPIHPPRVSAQWSYKNGAPFIFLPATILPAPLIIWLTCLWTQSKLSVYLGFHIFWTKISLPGVADD